MTSWRGRRDIHVLDVDQMTTACLWISTGLRRQRGRNDEDRGSNDEYCGRNDETCCPEPSALGLQPQKLVIWSTSWRLSVPRRGGQGM